MKDFVEMLGIIDPTKHWGDHVAHLCVFIFYIIGTSLQGSPALHSLIDIL